MPSGFGLREDPTVVRLEALAAEILGKEDALFVPTCMMANQIAIHVCCRPGDVFLTEAEAHVVTSESAAASVLSGAMPRCVAAVNGAFDLDDLVAALKPGDTLRPAAALVLQENTHVRSGGRVIAFEHMQAIAEMARAQGVPVHLDGARIFNAATALGRPASDLAQLAETVSFNLNKGLCAPLGAILAGTSDFVNDAVRVRQMFGGGWRPAGIVALQSMVGRLADDHRRAKRLAEKLATVDVITVDPASTMSNIVLVRPTAMDPETLSAALEKLGVLVLPFGPSVRLVTHREIDDNAVEETLYAFRSARSGDD